MRKIFVLLPLMLCSVCAAQLTKPALVHIRLVTDTSAIQGGKPFRVGLVFDIAPGWHIYWTNPGESGLATKAVFHFPPGFEVGPITFPVPSRFVLPGGILCYGYNSQLMLIANVTPPANLQPHQQVLASAETKYLVCEDVCINGKQDTSTMLSVSRNSGLRNIELFDHWSSLIPVPAGRSQLVKSATSEDNSVIIQWKQSVSEVQFFPGASQSVSIGHITVVNHDSKTEILFVPKYYDKSKVQPITSVVGFIDPLGVHRAIELPVSLNKDQ
ncbi:MAG TPA: protein-disulfide reductase DsbD domain-containing protein [Tepidisphaeraceae bacterium]|nr:protein-disulfide reductase DsbD domain-containing protein [Tepidisphaeraceae bacterium]